jgi:hypothetical protein
MRKNIKLIKAGTNQIASEVEVRHAEVSRDGLRAVDSGVFEVPSKLAVNIGDEYKYIQDIADTKNLRGAYLFQGSVLDESGYNVDPIDQTHFSISGFNNYDGVDYSLNTTSNHKFKGFYNGTINSGAKGVILENKFESDGTTPIHNFAGDFEIYAWVTAPNGGSSGTIYSKIDTNGKGIRLALNKSGTNYFATAYFRNISGGSSKSVSTSSSKTVTAGTSVLIRLQRVGNEFNLYMVDGTEDVPFDSVDANYPYNPSYPHSAGSFNVSQQATIGSQATAWTGNLPTSVTSKFTGELHQVRVYCGGILDSVSADQIFSSRPIPLIMKLAGTVWKIESSLDSKRIFVKGFGKVITDTLVSDQLITSGVVTGEFYEYSGSRTLTSFVNVTSLEIIRTIFAKINNLLANTPTFKLSVRDLTGLAATINSYTAEGNFLEIINQLMVINNKSFYVSPRGKCIIENKNTSLEDILKFQNGKYNINVDGFDDTNTVNDLYVSTRAGGNFSIVHADDTSSIEDIGLYSKRVLAPQLTDATSVTNFKNNFLSIFKDINKRYTIKCPFLLDFVRENFQVNVINTIKSLDTNSTIKSITWYYPDSRTVIETGDYLMDGFDLEKSTADTIQNLVTDTNLNP